MQTFQINVFNSVLIVFYMFQTSYVHHQEDLIVHAVLCGTVLMYFCKQSLRLEGVFDTIKGCMYNIAFLMMNILCSKHVEDKKN